MSAPTTPVQEPGTPNTPQEEPAEVEHEEDEDNAEEASSGDLYAKICDALDTEIDEGESIADFKVRVVQSFSDMEVWTDSRYEMLDKDVQDWVYDSTVIHKSNITKKKNRPLPFLPGLDPKQKARTKKRGRVSLSDEPKTRGRGRAAGNDCLTRTMKELVASKNAADLKAPDLVETLNAKYGKMYSTAAVRYAQQAFLTARDLIEKAHVA